MLYVTESKTEYLLTAFTTKALDTKTIQVNISAGEELQKSDVKIKKHTRNDSTETKRFNETKGSIQ